MKTHTFRLIPLLCLIGLLLIVSGLDARACATCFGATDSPLGKGLNWGIFALLVVVNTVIGGICAFFFYIARRASRIQAEEDAALLAGGAGASGMPKSV